MVLRVGNGAGRGRRRIPWDVANARAGDAAGPQIAGELVLRREHLQCHDSAASAGGVGGGDRELIDTRRRGGAAEHAVDQGEPPGQTAGSERATIAAHEDQAEGRAGAENVNRLRRAGDGWRSSKRISGKRCRAADGREEAVRGNDLFRLILAIPIKPGLRAAGRFIVFQLDIVTDSGLEVDRAGGVGGASAGPADEDLLVVHPEPHAIVASRDKIVFLRILREDLPGPAHGEVVRRYGGLGDGAPKEVDRGIDAGRGSVECANSDSACNRAAADGSRHRTRDRHGETRASR